jgi:hypothetical protein
MKSISAKVQSRVSSQLINALTGFLEEHWALSSIPGIRLVENQKHFPNKTLWRPRQTGPLGNHFTSARPSLHNLLYFGISNRACQFFKSTSPSVWISDGGQILFLPTLSKHFLLGAGSVLLALWCDMVKSTKQGKSSRLTCQSHQFQALQCWISSFNSLGFDLLTCTKGGYEEGWVNICDVLGLQRAYV